MRENVTKVEFLLSVAADVLNDKILNTCTDLEIKGDNDTEFLNSLPADNSKDKEQTLHTLHIALKDLDKLNKEIAECTAVATDEFQLYAAKVFVDDSDSLKAKAQELLNQKNELSQLSVAVMKLRERVKSKIKNVQSALTDERRKNFATNLKGIRQKAGLTQAELASRAGINRNTLVQYELSSRTPDLLTALDIANALNVDLISLTA